MDDLVYLDDLRSQINQIFHDIIPESVARKHQKGLTRFRNKDELNRVRLDNKDAVCALLEKICDMQNQPFHKIQTVIRKSPDNVQLFLLERVLTVDKWFNNEEAKVIIVPPRDFAEFVRLYLIDAYNDKLLKIGPTQ